MRVPVWVLIPVNPPSASTFCCSSMVQGIATAQVLGLLTTALQCTVPSELQEMSTRLLTMDGQTLQVPGVDVLVGVLVSAATVGVLVGTTAVLVGVLVGTTAVWVGVLVGVLVGVTVVLVGV